ncbi:hypothetical protein [Lactobacillus delbrueckii]|uniref:hypothetical protein n=1 Tax=Lactobacillus delbrueckii TaxID=1584 RepID=UPI003A85DCAA
MDIKPIIEEIEYSKHVYGEYPAEEILDMLKVDALQRIANALEKGGAGDALLHDKSSQKA